MEEREDSVGYNRIDLMLEIEGEEIRGDGRKK